MFWAKPFNPSTLQPFRFGLFPIFVEFGEGEVAHVDAVGLGHLLNGLEAGRELVDGLAERCFGIDLEEAAEVYDGEEYVAHFIFDFGRVAALDGLVEFAELHCYFRLGAVLVGPVEADARGLGLDALCAEK